jgi:MFS family permease
MGVHSTIRKAGFAAGPLLGGLLRVKLGFNATFVAIAIVFIVAAIMAQVMITETATVLSGPDPPRCRIFDRKLLSTRLVWLSTSTFIIASSSSMITALANQINVRLGQSAIDFGIAFSALTLSRIPLEVPFGHLADRIGRKPMILMGLMILAPATALLGYVTTTAHLVVLRICQGVATAAIFPPAFALAADYSVKGGEGLQISILPMGYHLGITMGPTMAGLLAVSSFKLPFLFGGLITLLGAGVIRWLIPETIGE